jgi:hypothetical protein
MGVELEEAQEPLMRTVLRVFDGMNAQNVANTVWAIASLRLEPGPAHSHLLRRVHALATEFNAIEQGQVKTFLKWLRREGCRQEGVEAALRSVYAGSALHVSAFPSERAKMFQADL